MARTRTPPSQEEQGLKSEIGRFERRLAAALAPYEPISAFSSWFDTLRAIEEVINLVTVDWDEDAERELFGLPVLSLLNGPAAFARERDRLTDRFSETFGNRFAALMVRASAIGQAFLSEGLVELALPFSNTGSLIGYLQSRRRHFVALLHLLPTFCRGRERVAPLDSLNIFLPLIEGGVQMMGCQERLLVLRAAALLSLKPTDELRVAMLDPLFLEPERLRVTEVDVTAAALALLNTQEPLPPDRLFSAAELRNDLITLEAAFLEFNLTVTAFSAAAGLIRRLSHEYIDRDFWIRISPADLNRLCDEVGASPRLRASMTCGARTYLGALATYAPFVAVDGTLHSSVTLLSRFAYWWRGGVLDRIKRAQIRSGFIFESAVADSLEAQGFSRAPVRRIGPHEFDVVIVRDGVIWNVQCKNNFTALDRVDQDADRFARYNRGLVRSYEQALLKERRREDVLKAALGLEHIQHVVVARFPVVTDNPRIVPMSRLGTFGARAEALLRA